MEVQEFVAETLKQIIEGVRLAQNEIAVDRDERKDGAINPERASGKATGPRASSGHQPIETVSFDIAITVSEETSAGGKGGLMVAGVGLGAKGEFTSASTAVSRVNFNVPIALPQRRAE